MIVPLVNRVIPVIEDDYVDVEFGTGCLKVTPAHDINDYVLGEKYNLPAIDIFNHDGTLNENGMQYEGMDRFKVRKQIEKDLEKQACSTKQSLTLIRLDSRNVPMRLLNRSYQCSGS